MLSTPEYEIITFNEFILDYDLQLVVIIDQ